MKCLIDTKTVNIEWWWAGNWTFFSQMCIVDISNPFFSKLHNRTACWVANTISTDQTFFFSALIVSQKCSFNALHFWFQHEINSSVQYFRDTQRKKNKTGRERLKKWTHDLSIEHSQVFAIQIAYECVFLHFFFGWLVGWSNVCQFNWRSNFSTCVSCTNRLYQITSLAF